MKPSPIFALKEGAILPEEIIHTMLVSENITISIKYIWIFKNDSRWLLYCDETPRDCTMDRPLHKLWRINYDFRCGGLLVNICIYRHQNCPRAGRTELHYAKGIPRPNECKIVAVNKQERGYSRYVYSVLDLEMLVDIHF